MPVTTITITLEATLTPEQKKDLQYLIGDAMYEFSGHRLPARQYVEKRYTDEVYPPGERREAKIAQVERRCALAKVLWDAALRNLKVE